MTGLRCWQCGVEPADTADITTFGDPEPVVIPTRWPVGDHEHAPEPPSPAQLVDDGHRTLRRIMEETV